MSIGRYGSSATSHFTYGSYSLPTKAAEQLGVEEHLGNVPQGGTAVDVGAGIGMGLGAFIYLRRPDIRTIAIDPGYVAGVRDITDESLGETTVRHFAPAEQTLLRNSNAWRNDMRPGSGENIPLESASTDLLVAYAAVPEYADDLEIVLEENIRVLKLGSVALHGPMHDFVFEEWNGLLQAAVTSGDITGYTHVCKPVETSYRGQVESYFTQFTK